MDGSCRAGELPGGEVSAWIHLRGTSYEIIKVNRDVVKTWGGMAKAGVAIVGEVFDYQYIIGWPNIGEQRSRTTMNGGTCPTLGGACT